MTELVTVTGASGMIGTALCAVLASRGIRFRALVRTPERVHAVSGADGVFVGCMSDPVAVSEACRGAGAVVHLGRSTHQLRDLCRFDYPALDTVITAANHNGAELHLTSSQAVFGGPRSFPPPILDDHAPPNPSSAYGSMKLAWEYTARASSRIPPVVYRLPVVIPRRLADAAEWLRYLLVSGCCHLDVDNRTLDVRPEDERFAHGGVSFVHVEDVAETIAANLFRKQARGTVAMLADPHYVTFRELAAAHADLARRHGLEVRTSWHPPSGGPGAADAMFRFDSTHAVTTLGFSSRAGRSRLFAKTNEWFAATFTPSAQTP